MKYQNAQKLLLFVHSFSYVCYLFSMVLWLPKIYCENACKYNLELLWEDGVEVNHITVGLRYNSTQNFLQAWPEEDW